VKNIKHIVLRSILALVVTFVTISLLLVLPFKWLNPPVSALMIDRWLASEYELNTTRRWLSWGVMPKEVALAVVTAEDQRFPLHSGIDFNEVFNAISAATKGKKLRGASTISQQVAKNMFLWNGRSWLRKGLEIWFTALIEVAWGKQRILEVYLNIAEWGPGIFGVEQASRFYFGINPDQLSPKRVALLASVLPNPHRYNPAYPSDYIQRRAEWNLQQQKQLGGVSWLAKLD
jgi:monofunctional biosynthetic peptidoglycan transglycosylase